MIKEYMPLILGVGVIGGLITWVEITLRCEGLSRFRARQSIMDRRLVGMLQKLDKLERSIAGLEHGLAGLQVERHAVKCLDCGKVDNHTEECALRMDRLVESPEDAARRRSQG